MTYAASVVDSVDPVVTVSCVRASGLVFALGTTTVNCSATDSAGNRATASFNVRVVDTTRPVITVPANMTVSATGATGATVTYAASAVDSVDPVVTVSCVPASGSLFALGTTTVNCSATDAAGNPASASFTVRVALTATGFYRPVDMGGVVNTVKNGSTVPLKFEVFAGTTELTNISIVNQPLTASVALCGSGVTDEIELLATGATSLRYDTTSGQFIYNWKTPNKPGYCYTVTVRLADGSTIRALFKLR